MSLNSKRQAAPLLSEIDISTLADFIKRMLNSLGITAFRPSIENRGGSGKISYPEADAILKTRGEETIRILDTLTSMGVFKRVLLEVIKVCPNCGSPSIELRGKCPSCGAETLVQYFGVDGSACPSCGARFESAQILLTCKSCKSSFTPPSSRDVPLYMYVLIPPEGSARPVLEERVGMAKATDSLSLDAVRIIDAFVEKLDKVLEEYFKAKPLYQISQSTSVQRQGDVTQVQLAPHLAKTYQVVRNRGRVTALDVSIETGRSRPLESVYLNQLVALGLVSKVRVGRKLYFTLKSQ
ncbi:MAG: hypothetical protein QXO86_00045 [Nitrososphaerota archaeon]